MALRFIDSFDHLVTADLAAKYTSMAACTISAGTGRHSSASLRSTNAAGLCTQTLDAQATWIVGFAVKASALPSANMRLHSLLDGGTVQCELWLNTDGTLELRRFNNAVTGGLSSNALSTNTWYYLEYKATIADSIGANTAQIRVNGVVWATVATGQDLKNTANASANQVRLGPAASNAVTLDFDDYYVLDGTGAGPHNDYLGDCRVDCVLPSADGTYATWTPSTGTDHYAVVDESSPNSTDYLSDGSVGERDTHAFTDLPSLPSATIYGAQLNLYCAKDDAGSRSVAACCKSGGTTATGATQALSTSYKYYQQLYVEDPDTPGTPWTEAGLNAAEFGVEVAA
jgi:hypothetical protein